MLGAPVRELILYSITLPFALYLAVAGPVGITDFAKLLLVQLGGALMYYSLAMITGLTGGKARGATGRFVAILAGLNITASSALQRWNLWPNADYLDACLHRSVYRQR